jgi:hypothetical protein
MNTQQGDEEEGLLHEIINNFPRRESTIIGNQGQRDVPMN